MSGVDIVISFDTTGSMYPALAEVRRKVEDFINTLFNEVPDLRIGLIAHGDYNDVYETEYVDLTKNKTELIEFIRTVSKTYGFGNGGELYEQVFHEVQSFNWRGDKRVYIMIGDEPPHRINETVFGGAGYRNASHKVVYDWKQEVVDIMAAGIIMYPVRALNRYDSVDFHNTLARMNSVPLLHLHQFSNIIPLLTAIIYKQESDVKVLEYGKQLQSIGILDRNLATALNLLINTTNLIGGVDLSASSADLEAVHPARFQMLNVDRDTGIAEFVRSTGAEFKIGRGFYELTKTELVQENKEVVLRNSAGDMFSGAKAREIIGLPYGQRGKIRPLRNLGYTVFIQSTSPNRKLMGNTRFLYEVESF
jgi:hypothetical protein